MLANTRRYACGHYIRQLVPGSLRVDPVKDFGAIAQGEHRFCRPTAAIATARRFHHALAPARRALASHPRAQLRASGRNRSTVTMSPTLPSARTMPPSSSSTTTLGRHRAGGAVLAARHRHAAGALARRRPEPAGTEQVDLVVQDMNFAATPPPARKAKRCSRDPRAPPGPAGNPAHRVDASGNGGEPGQGRRRRLPGKPWDDAKLLATVNNLLELSEARRELDRRRERERRGREQLAAKYDLRGLVFADPASERVVALACQVARSELPVLITGPNGAGKEKSPRSCRPIPRCAANPSSRSTAARCRPN
jgi:hypothetical protein